MQNIFLQATRILTVIRKGSSMPIVVEANDGNNYLLKLRGSLSGPMAPLCDWLSCTMGMAIGLPVVSPTAINIDNSTDNSAIDREMKDLVSKSKGLNIAFPFYDKASDFRTTDAEAYRELLARLLAFDIFLLNIDRQAKNTNILITDNRLLSFDYESSFLLMAIFHNTTPTYNKHILQQLRNSPIFGMGLTAAVLQQELRKLQSIDVEQVVRTLPQEWLAPLTTTPQEYRHAITQEIQKAVWNEELYLALLEQMYALPEETDEERKRKATENRKRFEQSFPLRPPR